MNCARIPISKAIIFSFPILTHPAKSPFSHRDSAMPGAELTLNLSSGKGSKIRRKLWLNEALLNDLSLRGCGKTEETPKG